MALFFTLNIGPVVFWKELCLLKSLIQVILSPFGSNYLRKKEKSRMTHRLSGVTQSSIDNNTQNKRCNDVKSNRTQPWETKIKELEKKDNNVDPAGNRNSYPCKSPKGKWYHCHLGQKKHNAAEEQSSCSACGLVFLRGGLYQELSMLWACLNTSHENKKWLSYTYKTKFKSIWKNIW